MRYRDVRRERGDERKYLAMTTRAPHFLLFSQAVQARCAVEPSSDRQSPEAREGGLGAWRFVLQADGDGAEPLEACAAEANASRERLELLAAVRGLEALDQPSQVTLRTTSWALHRRLQHGLDEWRENRWQWEHFGRMAPVKNADLWRRIDRAMRIHDIRCQAVGAAPRATTWAAYPVPCAAGSSIRWRVQRLVARVL